MMNIEQFARHILNCCIEQRIVLISHCMQNEDVDVLLTYYYYIKLFKVFCAFFSITKDAAYTSMNVLLE